MESLDKDVVRTSRAPSSSSPKMYKHAINDHQKSANLPHDHRHPHTLPTESDFIFTLYFVCLYVFALSIPLCICMLYLCIKIFILLIHSVPMAQLQAPAGPQRVMVNKDWICIGFDTVGQTHCAHCISLCICTLPLCICVFVFCFDIVGQTHSMRATNNSTVTLNLYWLWARHTLHMVQM